MPSTLRIITVRTRKERRQFLRLPWFINSNDPAWVPPLIMSQKDIFDREKHPVYRDSPTEFFLAFREDKPVGRIAVILNQPHNRLHGEKTGFFGFLEGINDPEVFGALLAEAEEWLLAQGCERIVGPMNPNINYELGVLVEGFKAPPYFMLTHNPTYYDPILQSLGYHKSSDFLSYIIHNDTFTHTEKLDRVISAVTRRKKITLREGRLEDWDNELRRISEIYNDAFSGHWGFVPLSEAEVAHMAADFKRIVNPELVLFGEVEGETVGFLLSLPNYNEVFKQIPNGRLFPIGWIKFLTAKQRINTVRVITLGIKKAYQHLGLGSLFYAEIGKRIIERGYRSAEMSWVVEDNLAMHKAAKLIGGEVYKRWRVYEKPLGISHGEGGAT